MVKAMKMICGFVIVLDLIGFFMLGGIHYLLLAGIGCFTFALVDIAESIYK